MKTLVLGGYGPVADALEQALLALEAPPRRIEEGSELGADADLLIVCESDSGAASAEPALQTCAGVARGEGHRPLVAVVTFSSDPVVIEQYLDAGVCEVIRWPSEEPFLRARMKSLLARARAAVQRAGLEESQAKFQLLFHNELDAISLTDLGTGRFLDVNEPWEKLYGYSREEALEKMGPKDVSAEVSATQAAIFRVSEAGASPCRHVRWHRSRAGVVFPVEIYAGTYQFRGRKVLVAMIRDITDRVKLESQLRQSDRMASVGTLAAGVAHEINNPLSFVLGNLEYLNNALEREQRGIALDSAALREAVSEARDGAKRVREIVRDLKTFSRADDEQADSVEVSSVMDVALRLLGNELRHRAELRRIYHPAPRARVNEGRLGQVFVNLITNAVQALPDRPRNENLIEVSVRPGPVGEVIGEVRDTGQGIAPENLQRIFDPFFTTKPVGEGTGLGLAICQGIVSGFGGRLEVESELGSGSVFRVILPAVGTTAPALAPAQGASRLDAKREDAAQRLRLLLIDDERNLGLVLGRALEHEVDLEFVTDARDGLKKIEAGERYDAVVCDLMMPSLSGMEFYEHLRRLNAPLADRTGFITGGTFTPPAREFASKMSGRIIEKPFMAEDLHSLVRTLSTF